MWLLVWFIIFLRSLIWKFYCPLPCCTFSWNEKFVLLVCARYHPSQTNNGTNRWHKFNTQQFIVKTPSFLWRQWDETTFHTHNAGFLNPVCTIIAPLHGTWITRPPQIRNNWIGKSRQDDAAPITIISDANSSYRRQFYIYVHIVWVCGVILLKINM